MWSSCRLNSIPFHDLLILQIAQLVCGTILDFIILCLSPEWSNFGIFNFSKTSSFVYAVQSNFLFKLEPNPKLI
jgi:hypothetical protein